MCHHVFSVYVYRLSAFTPKRKNNFHIYKFFHKTNFLHSLSTVTSYTSESSIFEDNVWHVLQELGTSWYGNYYGRFFDSSFSIHQPFSRLFILCYYLSCSDHIWPISRISNLVHNIQFSVISNTLLMKLDMVHW